MVLKLIKSAFNEVKRILSTSVTESFKTEFYLGINRINITRAKITAAAFIIMEIVFIAASFIIKGRDLIGKPYINFGFLFGFLLFMMIVHLVIFIKFQKDIPKYRNGIRMAGLTFTSSIILWSVGISLLGQLYGGQVTLYAGAILSAAIAPIYRPVTLLLIYIANHTLFLIFMPYFQKSEAILYQNYMYSTTILIASWAISLMRYKKHVEDFNTKKLIEQKNYQLEKMNKQLIEVNLKLEKLSLTDSLTGISNRFAFDREIKAEWDRCKRHSFPLSLLMIDVDFFKAFNDNYGHQTGDECIKKITGVLSTCARRSSDMAARYGGEEFVIIFPYTKKEQAIRLAESVRKSVEELSIPHEFSSVSKYVTISIGVNTVVPCEESSIEEFIRNVDKALYKAKEVRNKIVVA